MLDIVKVMIVICPSLIRKVSVHKSSCVYVRCFSRGDAWGPPNGVPVNHLELINRFEQVRGSLNVVLVMLLCCVRRAMQAAACIVLTRIGKLGVLSVYF